MVARVVKANELTRALDVLKARDLSPTTLDLLPGGLVRLHLTPPAATDGATDQESKAWDEALG